MGRIAGSPLKAAEVVLFYMKRMYRVRWYARRYPRETGALARTLPD